jgi:signal recognition particle subunit SRP54
MLGGGAGGTPQLPPGGLPGLPGGQGGLPPGFNKFGRR